MGINYFSKVRASAIFLCFSFLLFLPVKSLTAQTIVADNEEKGTAEKYSGPIIDMHLHSYSNDFWGPAPNPATGNLSPASTKEQMEQSFEVMTKYNIVLGAVSGISPNSGNDWHTYDAERTLRGIELREPSEVMSPDSLRQLIRDGQLDMLGEVGAQYFGYSPIRSRILSLL